MRQEADLLNENDLLSLGVGKAGGGGLGIDKYCELLPEWMDDGWRYAWKRLGRTLTKNKGVLNDVLIPAYKLFSRLNNSGLFLSKKLMGQAKGVREEVAIQDSRQATS